MRSFDSGRDIEKLRKKLMYQSKERGTLETCLLIGSFAEDHLTRLTEDQLKAYDKLLQQMGNLHSLRLTFEDTDLFDWITDKKKVPPEYDNQMMKMLKDHVKNRTRYYQLQEEK
jgi:succinate dehydrogenase assembly factor 2